MTGITQPLNPPATLHMHKYFFFFIFIFYFIISLFDFASLHQNHFLVFSDRSNKVTLILMDVFREISDNKTAFHKEKKVRICYIKAEHIPQSVPHN